MTKAQDRIDSRKNICKLSKSLNYLRIILHRRQVIKVAQNPLMKAILVARCCRKWVGKKVLALERPIKVAHLSLRYVLTIQKKRFMLDEKFQRNASKFVIFYICTYSKTQSFFRFSFHASSFFFLCSNSLFFHFYNTVV